MKHTEEETHKLSLCFAGVEYRSAWLTAQQFEKIHDGVNELLENNSELTKKYSRDDLKPIFERLASDLENDYGRIELPSFAITKWFNENYPESIPDESLKEILTQKQPH